jgi:hypothetical protein
MGLHKIRSGYVAGTSGANTDCLFDNPFAVLIGSIHFPFYFGVRFLNRNRPR